MKYTIQSSKIVCAVVLAIMLPIATVPVSALSLPAPELIVTELQTSNDTAGQEFIELYNPTDKEIDLSAGEWKLQHFTAKSIALPEFDWSVTKPTATIVLSGKVPAQSYFVLASAGYNPGGLEPNQVYNARLSDEGGGLRLISSSTSLADYIAWHSDAQIISAVTVYLAHPKKASLERQANEDGLYVDELLNVLVGFISQMTPSPMTMWQYLETIDTPDEIIEGPIDTEPVDTSPTETDKEMLKPIHISELLPNPGAPFVDSVDEYVELYNPNSVAIDISGYSLTAGLNGTYKHIFPAGTVIEANSYLVVTSGNSKLSFSNTIGRAQLLDPQMSIIDQTGTYENALDNRSWVFMDGIWQWSTETTIGTPNILATPTVVPKLAAKTTSRPKVAKTAVVKKAADKKVTKAPAKPKAKKVTAVKAAATSKPIETQPVSQLHGVVLATVGGLAVAYACYEYRSDLANRIYRIRNYRKRR